MTSKEVYIFKFIKRAECQTLFKASQCTMTLLKVLIDTKKKEAISQWLTKLHNNFIVVVPLKNNNSNGCRNRTASRVLAFFCDQLGPIFSTYMVP